MLTVIASKGAGGGHALAGESQRSLGDPHETRPRPAYPHPSFADRRARTGGFGCVRVEADACVRFSGLVVSSARVESISAHCESAMWSMVRHREFEELSDEPAFD